jgi:predicted transcriptional regulator
MFWFFGKKDKVNKLEKEVKSSFSTVKEDFNKVGKWIQHIDVKHKTHDSDLNEVKEQVMLMKADIQEIKDFISFFGPKLSKQLSKQDQTGADKQTAFEGVQTPVQTAVQTGILNNLTVMERAIVWALINSDMKLSYEDLAALLGKDKSTIRGQINTIRQKSPGVIEEQIEVNGKKRIYVPEKIRNFIVKSVKVRVKSSKKQEKSDEKEVENS